MRMQLENHNAMNNLRGRIYYNSIVIKFNVTDKGKCLLLATSKENKP